MTALPKQDKAIPVKGIAYLFFTFLKIGLVSFGGHMALVSMIQRMMVDKDKTLDNETILDAAAIGSLLPGPLAVNVVAYIGYSIRRKTGALVSIIAVLLPACSAMLILSWAYFRFGYKYNLQSIMYYVTGAVSAVILSTGIQLFTKEIKTNVTKIILCILSILICLLTRHYLFTLAAIAAGAICGRVLKMNGSDVVQNIDPARTRWNISVKSAAALLVLCSTVLLFIINAQQYFNNILIKIALVFSGISLSLFGGGYVMIPIMQTLFVTDLNWLTRQEFLDAIAFSQATPGPILVSATFTGYKLAGITGAFIATAAIFAPSAILMIIVSNIYGNLKNYALARHILSGVKAVVIGLIIASAVKIGEQTAWNMPLIIITLLSFIFSFRYKVSPVYIILSSLVIGLAVAHFSK